MPFKTTKTTKTTNIAFTKDEVKRALLTIYQNQFKELKEEEAELTRLARHSTGTAFKTIEFNSPDFELLQISYTRTSTKEQ